MEEFQKIKNCEDTTLDENETESIEEPGEIDSNEFDTEGADDWA
jgi:hypothetical protein